MAKDPAFLFYYRNWIASTQSMDADVRGWYIQLLANQAEKGYIPDDIEELAVLAGVKPSKYDRFVECWKRTLKAKFTANDGGKLVNGFLKNTVEDRDAYTKKQANRGVTGAYIKKAKAEHELTYDQVKQLSAQLYEQNFVEKSKTEREQCFKHTLEAFIANANSDANANANSINIGVRKKIKITPKQEEHTEARMQLSESAQSEPPAPHEYLEELASRFSVPDTPAMHQPRRQMNNFLENLDEKELEFFKQQTDYYFRLKEINKQNICNWRTWINGKPPVMGPLWKDQDYEAQYLLEKKKQPGTNFQPEMRNR